MAPPAPSSSSPGSSLPARPRLALTVGDPAGIGPEIVAAILANAELLPEADLVVLGPGSLRPESVPLVALEGDFSAPLQWVDTGDEPGWELGRPQESCGRMALAALRAGADLAAAGRVDGLVNAPVSKEALHLAGERVEGQTQLLIRWAGVTRVQMMAIAGELRVLLLTRHLPLRAALDSLDAEGVLDHLQLLHETLVSFGFEGPKLALAGLNPHAGEAGLLGSEEGELLEPCVHEARRLGLDVHGPVSPDTVFLRASQGAYHGVLALYHDQAFIPVKLHAPETALTVLAGLPYLRISPAHGTAFDIAGTGRANPRNLAVALAEAARLSRARSLERAR